MPNAKQQTAADAYAEKSADINAMLGLLKQALNRHQARESASKKNWCYTGDLGHVRQELMEILVFLSGNADETEAREEIEKTLAKARS